jgi:hypothetical protein
MPYRPPQREVQAHCFATSRWIRGTFHLSKLHGFDDHLRLKRFFPLTGVDLGAGPLPFVALRASAIHAVVPAAAEEDLLLAAAPEMKPRAVSCYLDRLVVHGTFDVVPGLRTSDHLANHDGFIVLRGCRLTPAVPGMAEPIPVVFVNALAIVAVAEQPVPGAGVAGERSSD